MGNTQSLCETTTSTEQGSNPAVPVSQLLAGESTERAGSEATNVGSGGLSDVQDVQETSDNHHGQGGLEAPREKKIIELHTAPIDPRFPSTNASRYCFVAYNEYYKCIEEQGEKSLECARYARTYRSLCPVEWIERWNELRDAGTWFGKY